MFSADLSDRAENLLRAARDRGLKIATAESCTGGLVAALLTEIPGSSDVFDRGFVTYSNQAKQDLLGVPASLLAKDGAVSAGVARAMVAGALQHSLAHIAVSITGIAGPGGGSERKPVGTVYIACGARPATNAPLAQEKIQVSKCEFGDIGRRQVRLKSLKVALSMIEHLF